ncbi:hypothetical protein BDF22DRAFT_643831 [Syncephalis plumigaleata]|nr:hypothetical protein BDF22DRAFT_643831 [Syncephalis plumigaleata]
MSIKESKVVLITGCSAGGIGASLAMEFARYNCIVYATARRPETMLELEPHGIHTLQLDVTREETIKSAVKSIIDKEGRIDMLINNAGIVVDGPVATQDLSIAREAYDINVWGLYAMTQTVLPHMMNRRAGTIVNIGSISPINATPFLSVYASSKAAVRTMSNTLRMEVKPFNINVTHIVTGVVRSNIMTNSEKYRVRIQANYSFTNAVINTTSPEEYAQRMVPQLLKPTPPREIYYGAYATLAWVLSFMPLWLVVSKQEY